MGSKKQKAPDYTGAAEAQGAASERIAREQLAANRPNITTPWGSQVWSGNPGDADYGFNINLTPDQQAALDSQQRIQAGRSDIAEGLLGSAGQEMQTPEGFWDNLPQMQGAPDVPTYGEGLSDYGQPGMTQVDMGALPGAPGGPTPGGLMAGPDYSGLQDLDMPEYDPRFAEAFYGRSESLLAPQMEQQRKALNTQLRNQGLTGQSEAYQTGTGNLQRGQGETLGRLAQDAVMQGAMEQQRQFGRQLSGRQQGAREEEFGAQFGLGADAQRFGQELGASTFGEQQRGARLGEQRGQINDAYREADYANQLRQQQMGEQLAQGGQQFSQGMQQTQMQNMLRQQGIAEQLQREGWSLNKINAMLSGQQVATPQMPDFKSATKGEAANYLGAAQAQGAWDQANNPWGPIGQIAGGMLGGQFGGALGGKLFG